MYTLWLSLQIAAFKKYMFKLSQKRHTRKVPHKGASFDGNVNVFYFVLFLNISYNIQLSSQGRFF